MAAQSVWQGDVYVNGVFVAQSIILPQNAVTNLSIIAAAGIEATKLEHQHQVKVNLGTHATSVVAGRTPLHLVYGNTANLVSFGVTCTDPPVAGGTATFDLLKNGVTMLTGTFNLDDTVAAYEYVDAPGYTSMVLNQGDQLDVVVTAVSGTVPKGVTAWLTVREAAQ